MKFKCVILSVAAAAVLCGCKGEGLLIGDVYKKGHSESFVLTYFHPENFNPRANDGFILLGFNRETTEEYGFYSKDKADKARYREKCERYGDFGFDYNFRYSPTDRWMHAFQDYEFQRIEITSDKDFDAAHEAGTSLADVFVFVSVSPIRFIRSGYTDKADWSDAPENACAFLGYDPEREYYHPVYGIVSELDPADLILLGGHDNYDMRIGWLVPSVQPEVAGTHRLCIRLFTVDGEVLEGTVDYTFK